MDRNAKPAGCVTTSDNKYFVCEFQVYKLIDFGVRGRAVFIFFWIFLP